MAEVTLQNPAVYFADPRKGKPIYNGSIYIGAPDLDPFIEANRVDIAIIQEDGTRVPILPAQQPLLTGAGGKILYQGSVVTVKVTDTVSMAVHDNADVQVEYFPRLNEVIATQLTTLGGESPTNGSFEIETSSGVPANWTLTVGAGSITVDTTESGHGIKSLKITGIASDGGGTAVSDKFNVYENGTINLRFVYRSTAANTLNEVTIRYYDALGNLLTNDKVLSDSTTNPIVYTPFLFGSVAPATAVQADILLAGVDSLGATTVGSTYFDGVAVDYLTSTLEVGEGGSVVDTVDNANAVSNVVIANATTGNNPSIDVGGEDVGLDVEGVTLKNGTSTAPNGYTGDLTGDVSGKSGTVANPNLTGDVTTTGTVAEITKPSAGSIIVKRVLSATDTKGTITGDVYPPLTSYVENANSALLGTVLVAGVITVNFAHIAAATTTTSTRIVLNQVAGTELTTASTTPVLETIDVPVDVGDIIFLQIKNTGFANDGTLSDVFITSLTKVLCIA